MWGDKEEVKEEFEYETCRPDHKLEYMNLREHFSINILRELISSGQQHLGAARDAVKLADELIAALNEVPK